MVPQIMPLPMLLALLIPWLLAPAPGVGSGAAHQAPGPVWRSECVDCPVSVFQIGDRSLALDAAGRPHVVYAGDELTYAWFDGVAWQREAIDAAPGRDDVYPSPASLALDAGGGAHVSYLSAGSTALRYARRTAQGWLPETVDAVPAGQIFNYDTALALDRAGRPHIAYLKNGQLWYAAWTGSAWRSQLVDAAQKAEFHVSLALDAADQPHISYGVWRGDSLYLKYARRAGGAWTSEVVEDGFLGEYNAIALDSQGAPHISYLDYARSQLKVAQRTPAGWQVEVIDGVQWFGGFTSIAIDSQDLLHVTYAGPPVGVRYARGTGGAWQLETVGSAGWFTSLALDPAGQPRMVYFDTAGRSLAYGRRDAAGWSLQAVDRLADVGSFNSLAVSTAAPDAAGEPAVAYYEAGHGDLRFARQSGSQWQVETVDGDAPPRPAVASGRPMWVVRVPRVQPCRHVLDQLLRRNERRPESRAPGSRGLGQRNRGQRRRRWHRRRWHRRHRQRRGPLHRPGPGCRRPALPVDQLLRRRQTATSSWPAATPPAGGN